MQIVIDIDEDIAQGIIEGESDAPRNIVRGFQATIADAIRKGTPLPKGHGKIIDESKITTVYFHKEEVSWKNIKYEHSIIDYTDAPTIIEADKESES